MQVTNFTQLIDWTRQLHQHLASALAQGGEQQQNKRTQLLLEALAEQEQRLSHTIKTFERTNDTEALDAYIPYLYSAFEQRPIDTQRIYAQSYSELSITEISEVIFDVHDQVIDLYQQLVNESQVPEAQDILKSFLVLEQDAVKELANKFEGMNDI